MPFKNLKENEKKFYVTKFRKVLHNHIPEFQQTAKDINFFKWKTYKEKKYVPNYKIEKNNRLIRLYLLPIKSWTEKDFIQANQIMKYYKVQE